MTRHFRQPRSDSPRCERVHEWPAADRAIWEAALAPVDVFEGAGGERSGHRAISNITIEKSYGRFVNHLRASGYPLDDVVPADRISPDSAVAYVEALTALGNASSTVLERLEGLGVFAKLADPQRDWSFLRRLSSRVRLRSPRLRKSVTVDTGQLVDLGIALMESASRRRGEVREMIQFRDGLMIAVLALRPLRLKNCADLRIGATLRQEGASWQFEFTGDEMKNHSPFEPDWPPDLVGPLETYLNLYRQRLIARRGRWHSEAKEFLWVSSDGSPMTPAAIHCKIVERTRAAFGKGINPHHFRAILLTTLAIHDPQHVRVGASLLSHRDLKTGERYYNMAGSLGAHQHYTQRIAELRARR